MLVKESESKLEEENLKKSPRKITGGRQGRGQKRTTTMRVQYKVQ